MRSVQSAVNIIAVIGLILTIAGLFDQQPNLAEEVGVWLLCGASAAEARIIAKRRSAS